MTTLFKVGEKNLNDIQLRNVTTLRFGDCYGRTICTYRLSSLPKLINEKKKEYYSICYNIHQ